MYEYLSKQPRWFKSAIFIAADIIAIVGSLFLAFSLRLSNNWPIWRFQESLPLLAILLVGGIVFNYLLNVNSIQLRSYEASGVLRTLIWSVLLTLLGTVSNALLGLGAPRTVPVIFGFIVFLVSLAIRLNAMVLLNWLRGRSNRIPVAIYGAGAGGIQLMSSLKNSTEFRPVLIIDDNQALQGVLISGLKVHRPEELTDYVKTGRVAKVLLAMPSLAPERKRQIIRRIGNPDCEVLELPSYVDMIKSGGLLRSLRPISPEDLLGRDGVNLDVPELENTYTSRNVMVTGAGGSIGSELCRKLVAIKPKKIVLFEQSEFALYTINQDMQALASHHKIEIVPILGSVTDPVRVENTLKQEEIDVVLHAAAYKHVPLVECNEVEGAKTNILGTYTVAKLSIKNGVKRFILISTDKAVRPTNVMGASKRLAEMLVQDLHSRAQELKSETGSNQEPCVFGIVRFGNVLGSSGSVIPLFKRQIAEGGPVTLTHKDVTRYFMTIKEAAHLVLLAGSFAKSSEVFVLDMGEPVRIVDLARKMIELSGLMVRDEDNPDGDIAIEITGLRPGEKLYEELLISHDTMPTPHPKILRAPEKNGNIISSDEIVRQIRKSSDNSDRNLIRRILETSVEDYVQQQAV